MDINFTSCNIQGCSNGTIFHYMLEPSIVTEVLDEDSEINVVLQKKEYRKRRVAMFNILQECVSKSRNAKISSHLIMIPKPNSLYMPMCLSGKTLTECLSITDNDIIVLPCGDSHSGINSGILLQLQEIIYTTGRFCNVVIVDDRNLPQYSRVHLIINELPNTKAIETQNIELQNKLVQLEKQNSILNNKLIQLEETKNHLENIIAQNKVNNVELEDPVSLLVQYKTRRCDTETQFFNIDNTSAVLKDPFEMCATKHSQSHQENCSQQSKIVKVHNLAAIAALQRETQFLQSAYGKRITNLMKKR